MDEKTFSPSGGGAGRLGNVQGHFFSAARRILLLAWFALTAIYAGVRSFMDLMGIADLFEKPNQALGFLERALNWLFQTPWWVAACLMIATGGWLFWVTRRRPTEVGAPMTSKPSAAELQLTKPADQKLDAQLPAFNPRGLYIGWVQVETQEAEKERIIRIVMIGFNATGQVLAIRTSDGAISYEVRPTSGGGPAESSGTLPPPRMMTEAFPNTAVADLSEFGISLEQRATPDLVAALRRVDEGYTLHLLFEKLSVHADPTSIDAARVSLPLWHGVALHKPNMYWPGRIITAVARA